MSEIENGFFNTHERPTIDSITERDWDEFVSEYKALSTSPQYFYTLIAKIVRFHESQLNKVLNQFKQEIEMNFKEESRGNWEGNKSLDSINAGSLQRIADAAEKMAGNYTQLQNDVTYWKERSLKEKKVSESLVRRNSSLKGVITKLKKRLEKIQ